MLLSANLNNNINNLYMTKSLNILQKLFGNRNATVLKVATDCMGNVWESSEM